jgi:hypothetical protein
MLSLTISKIERIIEAPGRIRCAAIHGEFLCVVPEATRWTLFLN